MYTLKLKEIVSFIFQDNFLCKTQIPITTVTCGYEKANNPWIKESSDVVRRLERGKCRKTHSTEKLYAAHNTI
jgi:hypothetical protein